MVLAHPDFAHQAEFGVHALQMRDHDQEQLLVHWEPQRISSFDQQKGIHYLDGFEEFDATFHD
jgi:hypothetical protein